jgi:hypothetical protein
MRYTCARSQPHSPSPPGNFVSQGPIYLESGIKFIGSWNWSWGDFVFGNLLALQLDLPYCTSRAPLLRCGGGRNRAVAVVALRTFNFNSRLHYSWHCILRVQVQYSGIWYNIQI